MVRALVKCKAMAEERKKGDKISLVPVAFRLYMLMLQSLNIQPSWADVSGQAGSFPTERHCRTF